MFYGQGNVIDILIGSNYKHMLAYKLNVLETDSRDVCYAAQNHSDEFISG